jgi:2-oxoisovalerate dehydrogenase E1 component alpha subunit
MAAVLKVEQRNQWRRAAPHVELGLADVTVIAMYRCMLAARRISERAVRLAHQGIIDVAIQTDGHEAAQVASMLALRGSDLAYLYYRSVAAAHARGMTPREIMLDYFGRAEGPSSGGRNLPGHWAKRALNLMTVSGSVGTHIPHAVGSAWAGRLLGGHWVTIAYFGDAAASKGDFHEGLSFAAIHRLPVILFCENNGIAISVPYELQAPVCNVADRAAGYGVPGVTVDGADAFAVYRATREAAERARSGGGPTLIEARVARLGQHTSQVGDLRSPGELAAARERDPLPRMAGYLRQHELLADAGLAALDADVAAEIEAAVAYAREAPSLPGEEAFRRVYATELE